MSVDGIEQPQAVAAAEKPKREKQGWVESILIALLLALAIRHFLIQAYKIPSGSMIPTLLIGDQLIASKISYGIRLPFMSTKLAKFATPTRGEIVVFRYPEDPSKDFIKRAIGLPGDRIKIVEGAIFVNDREIERVAVEDTDFNTPGGAIRSRVYRETTESCSYHVQYDRGSYHSFWDLPEQQLGDDEIFVMGDNRDHSNDSRFWGPVKLDLLEGRPLVIHFSWNQEAFGVRWPRLGTGLRCS